MRTTIVARSDRSSVSRYSEGRSSEGRYSEAATGVKSRYSEAATVRPLQ